MSEEIKILFKKYKVRIPKEKQGQSECIICKENHKYSLTWTSFLYEYEGYYYCYEHIINILLQQENKQLKSILTKLEEWLNECLEKGDKHKFIVIRVKDVLDKIQKLKEKYK